MGRSAGDCPQKEEGEESKTSRCMHTTWAASTRPSSGSWLPKLHWNLHPAVPQGPLAAVAPNWKKVAKDRPEALGLQERQGLGDRWIQGLQGLAAGAAPPPGDFLGLKVQNICKGWAPVDDPAAREMSCSGFTCAYKWSPVLNVAIQTHYYACLLSHTLKFDTDQVDAL